MMTPHVRLLGDLYADYAARLDGAGLVLHPFHRELAGGVESLGEVGQLDVAPRGRHALEHAAVSNVVDAVAQHQRYWSLAGLQQRPEVLAGQVRSERLTRGRLPLRP